ncbi:MAG: hypothetical protein ACR2MA_10460 [Egibacteraceae bacterium]
MTGPTRSELVHGAARTPVAELVWREPSGSWRAATVLPLVHDDALRLALTADRTLLARSLAASRNVVLGLTDPRQAGRGWQPLFATGTVDVRFDAAGAWTQTAMLDQELRKSERSRRLADTPLRRREYWWFLPRWIVTLNDIARIQAVAPRAPADALLCWDWDGEFLTDTVAVSDWTADEPRLRSLTPRRSLPDVADALLFGHDRFLPEGEPERSVGAIGELSVDCFTVAQRWGEPGPPPPARLLQRMRAQHNLRLACQAALRRGELGEA